MPATESAAASPLRVNSTPNGPHSTAWELICQYHAPGPCVHAKVPTSNGAKPRTPVQARPVTRMHAIPMAATRAACSAVPTTFHASTGPRPVTCPTAPSTR